MGENSKIEWTDATWNPVTGCTKVSPGCDHCYAESIAERFRGGSAFPNGFDITIRDKRLTEPFRWREPRRVFVNSMSDLFHEEISSGYIAQVFATMAHTPRHTYQVLTKRHGRMRSLLSSAKWAELLVSTGRWPDDLDPERPLDNVWLGVSVEDQKWADIRVPALRATPAAVRFLSCEPLLGPITFRWRFINARPHNTNHLEALRDIDWIIVGGESGASARPMDPAWAQTIRDEAVLAGAAFFFKQWGSHDQHGKRMSKHAAGRTLDGRTWDEYPAFAVTA